MLVLCGMSAVSTVDTAREQVANAEEGESPVTGTRERPGRRRDKKRI